jgi:hypothetical protein
MSNTEESGIGKSRGNAQAGGGPAADPTPSAGLDVQTEFVLLTGVAIIRATLGCAQLLFIQRWDNKLELPKGRMQAGDDSVNVGRLLKHLWEEKDLRVFTSFTDSQFRKRRLGGGGGGGAGAGAGGGRGCGSRGLKFGSLNILNHDAFIKWTEDYGLDVAEVRASREWRFDNVVRGMQDMDCDEWFIISPRGAGVCYVTSPAKWSYRDCNGEIVGENIEHPTVTCGAFKKSR